MRKDLNAMFTEEDWFIIYSALASMRIGEDTEEFPKAAGKIDATMKKVYKLVDENAAEFMVIDLVLMLNGINPMD